MPSCSTHSACRTRNRSSSAADNGDGDGDITAMADGLLILRYLFGFRSESLVKDAVAAGAVRKTAAEIETHLSALVPTG